MTHEHSNDDWVLDPIGLIIGVLLFIGIIALIVWWDPFDWSPNGNGIVQALEGDMDGDGDVDADDVALAQAGNGNGKNGNGFTALDINNTYAGNNCPGDKVATFAEVNAGGPQRQEIGGGGIQHVDYYPDRGVPAISYIVPPSEPGIWFGFGSIWEWQCTGFDFVTDATKYATGRMNNGHSGLVIDLRDDTAKLVANVGNLSEQQIRNLMSQHNAGQQSNPVMLASFTVGGSTSSNAAPAQAPAEPSCPDGVRGTDFVPIPGTEWNPEPTDSYRVVNLWSNWPEHDQSTRKFLLEPGEVPQFQGGGSYWSWPSNCDDAAHLAYDQNPNPPGR